MSTKKCHLCSRTLELDQFGSIKGVNATYIRNVCKTCRKKQIADVREKNRTRYIERQALRRQWRQEALKCAVHFIETVLNQPADTTLEQVKQGAKAIVTHLRRPSRSHLQYLTDLNNRHEVAEIISQNINVQAPIIQFQSPRSNEQPANPDQGLPQVQGDGGDHQLP